MPYHYTTAPASGKTRIDVGKGSPNHRYEASRLTPRDMLYTFEFYRFRFHFRTLDEVRFGASSGNTVRGAVGTVLRDQAPESYRRIFRPGADSARKTPSGLTDWPRPYVLRTSHLDGLTVPSGAAFFFDVHVFDHREPALPYFRTAFDALKTCGLGPGRGRAELHHVEFLDLDDRPLAGDAPTALVLPLDQDPASIREVGVRFRSPTELKAEGVVGDRPEFPILFGRLRDRLSTLRALYGPGPLDIDFRGMGDRARSIQLAACELRWERTERRSTRTGAVHPLGGFLGEAAYEGELAEFAPWLRAARWVGVGRQTVWGKGDVRVIYEK